MPEGVSPLSPEREKNHSKQKDRKGKKGSCRPEKSVRHREGRIGSRTRQDPTAGIFASGGAGIKFEGEKRKNKAKKGGKKVSVTTTTLLGGDGKKKRWEEPLYSTAWRPIKSLSVPRR